ncbi:hypothetical protein [Corynebacterium sp.]|uniref:hypothetical protein n=1 Tax=Corynebacterium sp. TaxID=1720 RepID=UPI0029047092|nr:hypothetical protein [Corynebacterium sp.]MDU3111038.1 hypothetical protein [Corynebacterium sp.]
MVPILRRRGVLQAILQELSGTRIRNALLEIARSPFAGLRRSRRSETTSRPDHPIARIAASHKARD